MCGIFGIVSSQPIDHDTLNILCHHSEQRGKDSSGLVVHDGQRYCVYRADCALTTLVRQVQPQQHALVLGHSRLITNGFRDNQPVLMDGLMVLHNGIVVNHESLWPTLTRRRALEIDTEVIAAIACEHLEKGCDPTALAATILSQCQGVVACALVLPKLGKLCLFSNNGSLYLARKNQNVYFASERFPLRQLGCDDASQVRDAVFVDIPKCEGPVTVSDKQSRHMNVVPALTEATSEARILQYSIPCLRRCTKCILPETMPFIKFDDSGVCNYCRAYRLRNIPKPKEELFDLVKPYRRSVGDDCIVPFSGGRDSCYGLHLVVNELKMKPVTYTYDWGMITDLGRRNISRMCARLGVENIIVADDISQKRAHIRANLRAWLKSPHLGMISILTAGDKHFFRHVETVKAQTGIALNLWGVNPLEVTHFKAGFLGMPPDFEGVRVYTHGAWKQLRYQWLRFQAMLASPGYFNRSLWDSISGEYYRSFTKKQDYYHLFDYWRWDERIVDETLDQYDWERATDTKTTWRIGDGTAAFYNYVYYTVAGFSEHDTFRSNQIREGDLSRSDALDLVREDNLPRYPNIKWYLDALGLDFAETIAVVNSIPKLYER